jgi:hypothetical protein
MDIGINGIKNAYILMRNHSEKTSCKAKPQVHISAFKQLYSWIMFCHVVLVSHPQALKYNLHWCLIHHTQPGSALKAIFCPEADSAFPRLLLLTASFFRCILFGLKFYDVLGTIIQQDPYKTERVINGNTLLSENVFGAVKSV